MTDAAAPNPRPQNPRVNETWIDDAGELWYWDGTDWVADEDPPELPGGDPLPLWLDREL
jgi:hypothetical protein